MFQAIFFIGLLSFLSLCTMAQPNMRVMYSKHEPSASGTLYEIKYGAIWQNPNVTVLGITEIAFSSDTFAINVNLSSSTTIATKYMIYYPSGTTITSVGISAFIAADSTFLLI